jgi:hypothetical protein
MTSPDSALHVEMVGDEIVVSLPESQSTSQKNNDHHVPMTVSEFLARARKLANDTARELGWIV